MADGLNHDFRRRLGKCEHNVLPQTRQSGGRVHHRSAHTGKLRSTSTVRVMRVHLIDGTYELFRQHFGQVSRHEDSHPMAAAAGVVSSTFALLADGATHVGVASDHTIKSFRNDLYAGYKDGAGMDEDILRQIPVMEDALTAAGFVVWPMVSHEADDAMAAAAKVGAADERVEQVLIVTPDKDLGQCVQGDRVVQFDRRKREILNEAAIIEKFGIGPASIPDYLGLVGDSADGFPGLPGWGAKSAARVLARYGHIEDIPAAAGQWDVDGLRGAAKLSATLQAQMEDAFLFRKIATVDTDLDVGAVDEWRWTGPTEGFAAVAEQIGSPGLSRQAQKLAAALT
jgi:5'-3' exonuclease